MQVLEVGPMIFAVPETQALVAIALLTTGRIVAQKLPMPNLERKLHPEYKKESADEEEPLIRSKSLAADDSEQPHARRDPIQHEGKRG